MADDLSMNPSRDDFAALLDESLGGRDFMEGQVVRGIVVRSRSIVGSIGAGIQTLFGGNISIYTKLCEQARSEAFDLMKQHAEAVGATAIIAMRYDATAVAPGVTEVLCYGTAVVVQRG